MTGRSKTVLVSAAVFAWGIAAPVPYRASGATLPITPPTTPLVTPPAVAAPATYDVKIAGWVKGSGHSTAGAGVVSITASIEDENGNKGDLIAANLTVDDKSHFRGAGTVLGQAITISGRIDAPGAAEKQLKTRRIVGTF